MAITGVTLNLNKTVTGETDPTSAKPSDQTRMERTPRVAGEKNDRGSLATALVVNQAISIARRGVGMVVGNLQGSQLQEQANALVSGGSSAVFLGVSFAGNPVLGAVYLGVQAVDMTLKQQRQNSDVAWTEYSREEYARGRGYSPAVNRSRNK